MNLVLATADIFFMWHKNLKIASLNLIIPLMNNEVLVTHKSQSPDEKVVFRLWLQRQFTERCKRNPRYSLRAFARSIEFDASSLSQVLSGKRPFSKKTAKVICDKLGASAIELKAFGLLHDASITEDYLQVNLDTFAVISDWYHYAILELTFIPGFADDARWVSRKLSITTEEAKAGIERLKRLGLLVEENGRLVKASKFTTNNADVNTSAAHKQLQRQVIEMALFAIDDCPAEEKDITSMTMAIDVTKIDKARDIIKKFRRELCGLLENGPQDRVYHLGIQLYPVSKKEETL